MCGALATSAPVAVEHRAGEIEPLLDVDRIGGVLQRHAHLLGDRHEQIVEDFEHDRVGFGAERGLRRFFSTRRSSTWFFAVISACQPGSTTIVWWLSMISAGPATRVAGLQRLAVEDAGVAPVAVAKICRVSEGVASSSSSD